MLFSEHNSQEAPQYLHSVRQKRSQSGRATDRFVRFPVNGKEEAVIGRCPNCTELGVDILQSAVGDSERVTVFVNLCPSLGPDMIVHVSGIVQKKFSNTTIHISCKSTVPCSEFAERQIVSLGPDAAQCPCRITKRIFISEIGLFLSSDDTHECGVASVQRIANIEEGSCDAAYIDKAIGATRSAVQPLSVLKCSPEVGVALALSGLAGLVAARWKVRRLVKESQLVEVQVVEALPGVPHYLSVSKDAVLTTRQVAACVQSVAIEWLRCAI